jgi:hypothetical protein
MIEEAKKFGLKIYPKHKVKTHPDADGFMHDSRKGFPGFLFRKATRTWNSQTHGKPFIHQSAVSRKLNKENTDTPVYKPWIFNLAYETEPWPASQRNLEQLI